MTGALHGVIMATGGAPSTSPGHQPAWDGVMGLNGGYLLVTTLHYYYQDKHFNYHVFTDRQ